MRKEFKEEIISFFGRRNWENLFSDALERELRTLPEPLRSVLKTEGRFSCSYDEVFEEVALRLKLEEKAGELSTLAPFKREIMLEVLKAFHQIAEREISRNTLYFPATVLYSFYPKELLSVIHPPNQVEYERGILRVLGEVGKSLSVLFNGVSLDVEVVSRETFSCTLNVLGVPLSLGAYPFPPFYREPLTGAWEIFGEVLDRGIEAVRSFRGVIASKGRLRLFELDRTLLTMKDDFRRVFEILEKGVDCEKPERR